MMTEIRGISTLKVTFILTFVITNMTVIITLMLTLTAMKILTRVAEKVAAVIPVDQAISILSQMQVQVCLKTPETEFTT